MKKIVAAACALSMLLSAPVFATPESDALLQKYQTEGAGQPDPVRGKQNWERVMEVEGEKMSCANSCHSGDFAKDGKHHKTGKTIHAMSVKVNPERYTNIKKIEKWFKRNCKDTWNRDCTAQEKADFLAFMLAQ